MTRRTFGLCLLVIAVLGTGLRLYRLEDPSLWADEVFQVRDALHFKLLDLKTGYYPTRLGLRATGHAVDEIGVADYASWRALGIDEWDMRIGTAVVACLSIPLLAWLSVGFLGRDAAAILALLLALSTWHLQWSQNARFYTPMFLYYNGALALYFTWSRQPGRWRLAAILALALLAVRTKPTALMLFGVIGIDLGIEMLRKRRLPLAPGRLVALVVGTALCLALALAVWSSAPPNDLRPFTDRGPGLSPLRVALGNAFRTGLPVLVFAAVGGWHLLRSTSAEQRRLGVFLAAATAVPLLSFSALATTFHTELRYTFVNLFGWLALASVGLAHVTRELWRQSGALVAAAPLSLVVMLGLLDGVYYYESGYGFRSRFREAFDYVAAHRKPEDLVYAVQPWVGAYYLGDPDVRREGDFEDSDRSRDEWLVVESQKYEINRARPHPLDGRADLEAVFPTRVPFPQTTVRLYRSPRGRSTSSSGS